MLRKIVYQAKIMLSLVLAIVGYLLGIVAGG